MNGLGEFLSDSLPGVFWAQLGPFWTQPWAWAMLLGAVGLCMMFSPCCRSMQLTGQLLSAAGLVVLGASLPHLGDLTSQVVFWFLGAQTLGAAACSITCRSPFYTAIWFALSLLGSAGLFLFQGAQFLGVATVVVYAGAIIVTFLFVLMLAQPQGFSAYDRISWSAWAAPLTLLAAALVVGLVLGSLAPLRSAAVAATPSAPPAIAASENHVARFGAELFSKSLLSVEIAGTLLLVALVGAVAIVIQGHRGPAAIPERSGKSKQAVRTQTASVSDRGELVGRSGS